MSALFHPKDIARLGYLPVLKMMFRVAPFSLLVRFGYLKGRYVYRFDETVRDTVLRNLSRAYGNGKSRQELLALTRSVIQTYQVWGLCHYYFKEKLSDEAIEGRFPVLGLQRLDEALRKGKGAIVLSGHLGVQLITIYLLQTKGYPVKALRFKGSKVFGRGRDGGGPSRLGQFIGRRFALRKYEEPEDSYFPISFNSRPLLSFLRENGVLFIMGDGLHTVSYLKADFLNNTVPFSLGAMALARESGAAVLPLHVEGKMGTRGYRTTIGKPMELQFSAHRLQDIRTNTLEFVRDLEAQIWREPELWRNWLYRDYFDTVNRFFEEEPNRHGATLGAGRA